MVFSPFSNNDFLVYRSRSRSPASDDRNVRRRSSSSSSSSRSSRSSSSRSSSSRSDGRRFEYSCFHEISFPVYGIKHGEFYRNCVIFCFYIGKRLMRYPHRKGVRNVCHSCHSKYGTTKYQNAFFVNIYSFGRLQNYID